VEANFMLEINKNPLAGEAKVQSLFNEKRMGLLSPGHVFF
jgi:hypothetical protein